MILYPAIDILGGNAVRLVKGDFQASKVYDQEPLAAAMGWVSGGARFLHVVDLDGARTGAPVNTAHLAQIVRTCGVPVQYGGGLRTVTAVEAAFGAGATRVILGTAAFTETGFLEEVARRWTGRVLVAVDVRGGRLTTAGWTRGGGETTAEVIAGLRERGVRDVVYTNVDRDGMLEGPDIEEVARVAAIVAEVGEDGERGTVIYSGGIGRIEDLVALRALGKDALEGVIVGKALYERRFTVAEGLSALAG